MKIRRAPINDALGIARVLHVGSSRETYAGVVSQKFLDSLKVEDCYDFSFIWDDLRELKERLEKQLFKNPLEQGFFI